MVEDISAINGKSASRLLEDFGLKQQETREDFESEENSDGESSSNQNDAEDFDEESSSSPGDEEDPNYDNELDWYEPEGPYLVLDDDYDLKEKVYLEDDSDDWRVLTEEQVTAYLLYLQEKYDEEMNQAPFDEPKEEVSAKHARAEKRKRDLRKDRLYRPMYHALAKKPLKEMSKEERRKLYDQAQKLTITKKLSLKSADKEASNPNRTRRYKKLVIALEENEWGKIIAEIEAFLGKDQEETSSESESEYENESEAQSPLRAIDEARFPTIAQQQRMMIQAVLNNSWSNGDEDNDMIYVVIEMDPLMENDQETESVDEHQVFSQPERPDVIYDKRLHYPHWRQKKDIKKPISANKNPKPRKDKQPFKLLKTKTAKVQPVPPKQAPLPCIPRDPYLDNSVNIPIHWGFTTHWPSLYFGS
jgi:hypothetical protein